MHYAELNTVLDVAKDVSEGFMDYITEGTEFNLSV